MECDDPFPRFVLRQPLDFPHKIRSRTDIARKSRRIQNHRTLIFDRRLHLRREINVRFGPSGFIGPKESVFTLQFFKHRRAARPLRTIEIEPSPNSKMIVYRFITFLNGIPMKQRDFYSGKKVRNIITGSKNSDRIIVDHIADGTQAYFIITKRNRTIRLDKPGRLIATPTYLVLQRPKNRISIRQCNEQQIFFHHGKTLTVPILNGPYAFANCSTSAAT